MEKDTMFMDQKTQYYNLLRSQGYSMGIERLWANDGGTTGWSHQKIVTLTSTSQNTEKLIWDGSKN